MKFLENAEKNYGRYAISNLTLTIVMAQSLCFVLVSIRPVMIEKLLLRPHLVLQGEIWRLVSFLLIPPQTSVIFAIFALYIFHFMGSSLEEEWGDFRYNVYLLLWYVTTVASAFFTKTDSLSNIYMEGTVFLAFAYIYPELKFLLFFIIPVKVKYLAWVTWCIYGLQFFATDTSGRILILASLANFFLFFGVKIFAQGKAVYRKKHFDASQREIQEQPLHQCDTCKVTEKIDTDMEFRVCSKCTDGQEYCVDHISSHNHR